MRNPDLVKQIKSDLHDEYREMKDFMSQKLNVFDGYLEMLTKHCGAPYDNEVVDRLQGIMSDMYDLLDSIDYNSYRDFQATLEKRKVNKLNEVERLAELMECDYNDAFDLVYQTEVIYDENEIDYGL